MNEKIRVLEEQLKGINADPQSDPMAKIKVLNNLAWELRYTDLLRSYELSRQVQELLESHPHPGEQARCQAILAEISVEQGDYQQALRLANTAMRLAEQIKLDKLLPYLSSTLGGAHWLLGNQAEALAHFQQQYRTSQQLDDTKNEAEALNNMGLIYDESGDYNLGRETYQRALTAYEILQDKAGRALVLNNLAMNLYETGDYSPALANALQSLELAQITGNQTLELAVLDTIGFIYTKQLDYSQALTYFQRTRDWIG